MLLARLSKVCMDETQIKLNAQVNSALRITLNHTFPKTLSCILKQRKTHAISTH